MYRWVDHTAEVELEIEADSEPEVFADGMLALAELLGFASAAQTPDERLLSRSVSIAGSDRAGRFAGWLEELVYLAESEGFVAVALATMQLRDDGVDAHVRGLIGEPPPLVKAVTLHRLLFEPRGAGYVARVVLDV